MIFYLNNYRGFNDAIIKTSALNILVGENSSGKSSFLSLLSILSDSNFLVNSQFKNQYFDLGTFNELITENRKDTDPSIYIGIIKEGRTVSHFDSSFIFDAILLQFNSLKGYSHFKSAILIKKNSVLKISYLDTEIQYVFYKIDFGTDNKIELLDNFKKWAQGTGFEKLEKIRDGSIKEGVKDNYIHLFRNNLSFVAMYISHMDQNKDVMQDFQMTQTLGPILTSTIWFAPIRTKPKRIYEAEISKYSADGSHTPNIIRDIYDNKDKEHFKRMIDELESFGKATGLFDKILIKNYGKKGLSAFELNIKLYKRDLKISNVGYGVSQILPILIEIIRRDKESVFLIQQPEVHLHPRSQAQFGELVFNESFAKQKNFFIETHSDFIVDRIRVKLRNNKSSFSKKVNLLFFENTPKGNIVHNISINKNGDYESNQPQKFREFFLKEKMDLLGF